MTKDTIDHRRLNCMDATGSGGGGHNAKKPTPKTNQ